MCRFVVAINPYSAKSDDRTPQPPDYEYDALTDCANETSHTGPNFQFLRYASTSITLLLIPPLPLGDFPYRPEKYPFTVPLNGGSMLKQRDS